MTRKEILLSKLRRNSDSEEEFLSSDIRVKSSNSSQPSQKEEKPRNPEATDELDNWLDESYDGQLAVDVYQNDREIVIKSTIAGVKPEDIDIAVHHDMVTIKGVRRNTETVTQDDYFYQECYWGGFSRTIILPVDIITDRVDATLENGILTVRLPKAASSHAKSIRVKAV